MFPELKSILLVFLVAKSATNQTVACLTKCLLADKRGTYGTGMKHKEEQKSLLNLIVDNFLDIENDFD
jgi:hypothetical protein